MNYPQARLWLLLIGFLLSRQISWAQDSSAGLNDLNLVLGAEPYSTRDYLLAEMDSFATTHRLHLLITLLDQEDVYTAYARQDEDALLAQAAPALVITTWHQGEGKYYQRCEVQVNKALATRLPQATAQQLVEEMLNYYGKGDMMAQDAMNSGLTVALLKLSEYLNAVPPPEAVPTITFANAPAVGNQPALGLDAFTDQVHQDHYEQIRINEEPYAVAWKALPSGGTTSVLTQVEKGVSFPPGVVFRQNGNTLSSQPATQNHQQQLTLTGQMHEQEGSLEVYASREEDAQLVGKLKTISYDALYKRLVLVVLDDVTSDMLYLDRVSRAVQATLAQAGVSLTIEIQKFDTEWVDRDVPLNDETTGMLSNYPKELKRVIKDYRQEHEQESETAYIFLAGSSSTGKLGYMPKKRPYGFVYLNAHYYAKEVAKTIAHELGHGLFRLEHTFEAYPAFPKGSTDNLMDYGKGTRLHKYQWDLVHDPKAMLGWFQDQEEGAMLGYNANEVFQLLRDIRESILYATTVEKEAGTNVILGKNITMGEYTFPLISVGLTHTKEKKTLRLNSFVDNIRKAYFENPQAGNPYGIDFKGFIKVQVKTEAEREHLVTYLTEPNVAYADPQKQHEMTLDGTAYSLKYVMDELEKVRVRIKQAGKYHNISYKHRLILDLPIIEWKIGWPYSSAFMLHWLTTDSRQDIKFDNAEVFLTKFELFEKLLREGQNDISDKEIYVKSNPGQEANLSRIINVAKNLKIGEIKQVVLENRFEQNPNGFNYFANSFLGIQDFIGNYNDLKGSLGKFSILFYYTGTITRESKAKAKVEVDNLYYRINDSFDFDQEEGFLIDYGPYDDQPLGNWTWDLVDVEVPSVGGYLTNKDFREFCQHTGKNVEASNYRIVTDYILIKKAIDFFDIDLINEEREEK